MARGGQVDYNHSFWQPVGNKKVDTLKMEMEMEIDLPKTEDRLGNPNRKWPTTTMPAGLPEKSLDAGKDNFVWDTHNTPNESQHCRSGRGCSAALLHSQAVQETGTCHRGM